ncbi:MAG: right-handed parallel beta-helix repeat-containing protein [Dehalococcoidia bacterium]
MARLAFLTPLFAILAVAAWLPAASSAGGPQERLLGQTFVVNRFGDAPEDAGGCEPLPRDCTLREAVIAANVSPNVNIIQLGTGTYNLTQTGTDEDNSGSGDLDILTPVIFRGEGPDETTIDANDIDRVFDVQMSGSQQTAFRGLTIRGGHLSGGASGAGIAHKRNDTSVNALVTLKNVIVTDNHVDDCLCAAGGILNRARMRIIASEITGNSTTGDGGAIFSDGNLKIRESSIHNNQATTAGFSNAGGIQANGGPVVIINSTISTNSAAAASGISVAGGDVTVILSTIAFNTAVDALAVGGVRNSFGTLRVSKSIISDNQNANCDGVITAVGNNISDDTTCWADSGTNDVADPDLLVLGDYGGPTPNHPPNTGSPAVDAFASCINGDQRGISRPQDGDLTVGALCDKGAVERQSSATP